MSFTVGQIRKNGTGTGTYMIPLATTPTTIISANTFGGDNSFTDYALQGNFSPDYVYFIRFKIHKIPQYFYSGWLSKETVNMYNAADTLGMQLTLRNSNLSESQETPQVIGQFTVPQALSSESNSYASYSFVFTPSKNFNRLVFKINRDTFDAINVSSGRPRNWLIDTRTDISRSCWTFNQQKITVATEGPRIICDNNENSDSDICTLQNILQPANISWLKFGYQSRPGSLIVVNGEPIRVGRSGIYEINNGTPITSFMIASPKGYWNKNVDAFLLDYAYDS